MVNNTYSHKNLSDDKPQPIKIETVSLTSWLEEMEEWRYLRDVELQLEILKKEYDKFSKGVFVEDFLAWLESKGILLGGDEDKIKKWNGLRNSEKANLVAQYIKEKRWIYVFTVKRERGEEIFISLGYNDVVLPAYSGHKGEIDYGDKILMLMFTPLLSAESRVEVLRHLASLIGKTIDPKRIDPVDKIRFQDAIFDMELFEFIKPVSRENVEPDYYFMNYSPLFTASDKSQDGRTLQAILEDIKNDRYDITTNKFYQFYRKQFSDEDWHYFVDLVGAILKPTNSKLIGYLDGPTDAGKSTMISLLTRPIEKIVGTINSNSIKQNYIFALEGLVGKQILIVSEKVDKLPAELLNMLVGKRDKIRVERKGKSAVTIESLKLAIFAGNGPPRIEYMEPDTLDAFLNRLSYIKVLPIMGEKIEDIDKMISDVDILAFIMWCGWQLRKKNWKISKRGPDEVWKAVQEEGKTVKRFLQSDWVTFDSNARVKGTVAYNVYRRFVVEVLKQRPISMGSFYSEIDEIGSKYGVDVYVREGVKWIRGLKFTENAKNNDDDEPRTDNIVSELSRFDE
jgi:phage/plasmid-associated DNA primase